METKSTPLRRAHFIIGFRNWGKTTVIFELFNRMRFPDAGIFQIPGVKTSAEFMVQSQSNDDVGSDLSRRVNNRVNATAPRTPDLICALCPSMEQGNVFTDILSDTAFNAFNEFHFYLLRYKWEHHAELLSKEIQLSCGNIRPKSYFYIIDEGHIATDKRTNEKIKQIKSILNSIYP